MLGRGYFRWRWRRRILTVTGQLWQPQLLPPSGHRFSASVSSTCDRTYKYCSSSWLRLPCFRVSKHPQAPSQTLVLMAAAKINLSASTYSSGIYEVLGVDKALQFFAGYVVELSLSVDNLFVFLLLFNFFKASLTTSWSGGRVSVKKTTTNIKIFLFEKVGCGSS